MGCPLWEESPRKAAKARKSKSRVVVRQRQPLPNDYGAIRRRPLPRDAPTPYFFAGTAPRESASYHSMRRRIRQDRMVRDTLQSLMNDVAPAAPPPPRDGRPLDHHLPGLPAMEPRLESYQSPMMEATRSPPPPPPPPARTGATFRPRTQNVVPQPPPRNRVDPTPNVNQIIWDALPSINSVLGNVPLVANGDTSSIPRTHVTDGFWDAMGNWDGADGGRATRAQLEMQLNALWPCPASPNQGSSDVSRPSSTRLDFSAVMPVAADITHLDFALDASRRHRALLQDEYQHRDSTYRSLLIQQSRVTRRAINDFNASRIRLDQVQRPIDVYRELLRLGPDQLNPAIPAREPAPPPGDSAGEPVSPVPNPSPPLAPIGQADGAANHMTDPGAEAAPATNTGRIDGLGDRNRSLSPEGDNWDTLRSTLTPDPLPPSVGSSFASAAGASQNTGASANSNTSQQTDLTHISVDDLIMDVRDLLPRHRHRDVHGRFDPSVEPDDFFNDDDDDHECDETCVFCPAEHHALGEEDDDMDEDDLSEVDPELEREAESELRNRWRDGHRYARQVHDMRRARMNWSATTGRRSRDNRAAGS